MIGPFDENAHRAVLSGRRFVGVALFPKESPVTGPREWAEAAYNITRWTQMPRGGHFPAAEESGLLAGELREFFRPLR